MTMYDKLPKDPVILLSFINTQLRDSYESLADLACALCLDADELTRVFREIDYEYDAAQNQFI